MSEKVVKKIKMVTFLKLETSKYI